jgi:hypothetical protein
MGFSQLPLTPSPATKAGTPPPSAPTPPFVNYWSYDFFLESDGDTYNRSYLKSVEVRKVGQPD